MTTTTPQETLYIFVYVITESGKQFLYEFLTESIAIQIRYTSLTKLTRTHIYPAGSLYY